MARLVILGAGFVLAIAVGLSPVRAGIINGDFETGTYAGWDSTDSIYGSSMAIYESKEYFHAPSGGNYLSHQQTLALGPLDGDCYTQMGQVFSAEAGDVVRLSYWARVDVSGLPPAQEFNTTIVDAEATVLIELRSRELDQWVDGLCFYVHSVEHDSFWSDGWQQASFTIPEAGQYVVTFETHGCLRQTGYLDYNWNFDADKYANALLYVDNVELVPEPGALSLLALGGLVALLRKRP